MFGGRLQAIMTTMMETLDVKDEPIQEFRPTDRAALLHAALKGRTARLGVIGMGYVGLPMALEFTRVGFDVVGIDVDPDRCEALLAGKSYIDDVSNEMLLESVRSGKFHATADATALNTCDVVLICVPTPL